MSVRVYDLAHARAGDKGNTSNISVICYDAKHWDFLDRELTPERVAEAFKHIAKGPVKRHPLRNLKAFNFVIENALGAVGRSAWASRSSKTSPCSPRFSCGAMSNHSLSTTPFLEFLMCLIMSAQLFRSRDDRLSAC